MIKELLLKDNYKASYLKEKKSYSKLWKEIFNWT